MAAAVLLSSLTGSAELDRAIARYARGKTPTISGDIVPVTRFRDPAVAAGQCACSADHFSGVLRDHGFSAHIERWDEAEPGYAEPLRGEAHLSVAAQLCDAMLSVVDERDRNTGAHERTVGILAQAIAHQLGMSAVEAELVVKAAELHDIGKVAIPDSILHKVGRLTKTERAVMQQHSAVGERMLAIIPALANVSGIVRAHHERFDGGGYPDGLAGNDIPLAARILAVADSFEAMTAERSYRARMTKDEAIAELRRCSGTQFDPRVVDAFLVVLTNPQGGLRASRHYLTVVAHETDLFTVDWTASQLGYAAFPLVQRQGANGTWALVTA